MVVRGRNVADHQRRSTQTNATTPTDPQKALVINQTYPSNVLITAEVEVNIWNPGDKARAGVGLYTNTSTGDGYNLVFHGTNQVQFLDDGGGLGQQLFFHLAGWHLVLVPARGKQRDVAGQSVGGGDRGTANWMFQQTGWTDRTGGAPALNGGSASETKGGATASFESVSVTTTSVRSIRPARAPRSRLSRGRRSRSARQRPPGPGLLPTPGTSETAPRPPACSTLFTPTKSAGTYNALLTVTDGLGIAATSPVTVTVNASPVLFNDTFSSSTPGPAWSFVGGTWQITNGTSRPRPTPRPPPIPRRP